MSGVPETPKLLIATHSEKVSGHAWCAMLMSAAQDNHMHSSSDILGTQDNLPAWRMKAERPDNI